jgi:hypothetical protein
LAVKIMLLSVLMIAIVLASSLPVPARPLGGKAGE